MANCYVKAYYDWIEQTASLSDAERGRLFIAILEYARSGLEPKLDGREGILFPAFKVMLDRDAQKSATNSKNGAKGGRGNTGAKANQSESKRNKASQSEPKRTKANQSEPKATKDIRQKTEDTGQKTEDECSPPTPPRGSKRADGFEPPTLEDVEAYVRLKGYAVDPKRFWEYFNAGDWIDSEGKPVRSWKQKLVTWEHKENGGGNNGRNTGSSPTGNSGKDWGVTYTKLD